MHKASIKKRMASLFTVKLKPPMREEKPKRKATIRESLALLCKAGLPVSDVLDVGVLHGTPVLMDLFGDKTHHLFEPVDDYFPTIRANYAAIDHRLVHVAVSDEESEVLIHSAKKLGNDEISHSWITDVATESSRKVPAITLDSYIAQGKAKAPFLLKIDVDGAPVPAAILRGAAHTLEQCSAVVIEMTVDRFFERASLLDAAGFDLWDMTALCYYDKCLWQFDAVYVKRTYKETIPVLQPMHNAPFDIALWQQG